jgi:succinate-acetate transporter protein
MDTKLGNPAVVGLAGFGLTTFALQLHNLGVIGLAPVIWLGIVFGGGCQLFAGLMEFKTGNNFGFMAFTGYGAFWISLALMLVFGTNPALGKAFPVLAMGPTDLGWFLVAWTIFTAILFWGSMRHNTVLALVFLTLLLGFIGLDLGELAAMKVAGTFAAWDLIACAFLALYLGASNALADSGVSLPIGGAWMK